MPLRKPHPPPPPVHASSTPYSNDERHYTSSRRLSKVPGAAISSPHPPVAGTPSIHSNDARNSRKLSKLKSTPTSPPPPLPPTAPPNGYSLPPQSDYPYPTNPTFPIPPPPQLSPSSNNRKYSPMEALGLPPLPQPLPPLTADQAPKRKSSIPAAFTQVSTFIRTGSRHDTNVCLRRSTLALSLRWRPCRSHRRTCPITHSTHLLPLRHRRDFQLTLLPVPCLFAANSLAPRYQSSLNPSLSSQLHNHFLVPPYLSKKPSPNQSEALHRFQQLSRPQEWFRVLIIMSRNHQGSELIDTLLLPAAVRVQALLDLLYPKISNVILALSLRQ
ncbi:hypothetical protein SISSUDRAFT_768439 [Sistotremastrum suecicum HHB10207 ss-3]|uniref:Uncharacterized protein n=1 Tax=Sistotremastrum suecicum HHB10207 ss-3 TaxID=1314776 RepID=A0A166D9E9_9AGAM|nr:hypothetical protein SISSUDRAFT_768439 [Sistotremastrum suecicum HHB10207 ss-3]